MYTNNRGRGRRGRGRGRGRARSDQHAQQAAAAEPVEEQVRCPLLPEMPAVWLTQFISILHKEDRKAVRALLAVNKALFNTVLQHIPFMRLYMTLGPAHGGKWPQGDAAARVLAMANNAKPKSLMLDARPAATALNDVARVGFTTAVKLVITKAASDCRGTLDGVEGLALHAVKFDNTFCPTWLSSACPSITKYALSMSSITCKPDAAADIQNMPRIESLTLYDIDMQLKPTQLYGQLSYFPNMNTLGARGLSHSLALACQMGLKNVTHLIVEKSHSERDFVGQLPVALKRLTNLAHLQVYGDMADADFNQVAQMPNIQKLSCASLKLYGDYSKMRCSWNSPITLSVKDVTIGILARLPLKHIASISGSIRHYEEGRLTIKFCVRNEGSGLTKIALQNLEDAPALRFDCKTLRLKTVLSSDELNNTAALRRTMLQVIPRLTSATTQIEFSRLMPACRECFADFNEAMQGVTNQLTVVFSACIFEEEDLPYLVPSLPSNVHTVRLVRGSLEVDPLTEHDMQLVCESANRAVTIQIPAGSHNMSTGWRQRLLGRIRASKKQTLVKIEQANPPYATAWDDTSDEEYYSDEDEGSYDDGYDGYDDYYGSETSDYEDEFDAQEARALELAMAGLGCGYRYEDEHGFLASHYAAGFDDPTDYGWDDDDDDEQDHNTGTTNTGNTGTGHQAGPQGYCPCCSNVTVRCTTGASITVPLALHNMIMRGMAMAPNPFLPGAPENAMELVEQAAEAVGAAFASSSLGRGGGGRGVGRGGGGGAAGVRVAAGSGAAGRAAASTTVTTRGVANPAAAATTTSAAVAAKSAAATTSRPATATAAPDRSVADAAPAGATSESTSADASSQAGSGVSRPPAAGTAAGPATTTAANTGSRSNIPWVTVRLQSGK